MSLATPILSSCLLVQSLSSERTPISQSVARILVAAIGDVIYRNDKHFPSAATIAI